jgi:hypothetical protein
MFIINKTFNNYFINFNIKIQTNATKCANAHPVWKHGYFTSPIGGRLFVTVRAPFLHIY